MKIAGEQNQRKYWRNSKTSILNFTRKIHLLWVILWITFLMERTMVNSVYLKNLINLNRSCKTKHLEMMAQLPNLLSFLEYLENHFIKSLHFSHVHGQLCSSQRRVLVIILGNKIRINVSSKIGALSHQQMFQKPC